MCLLLKLLKAIKQLINVKSVAAANINSIGSGNAFWHTRPQLNRYK